jgi:phage tail-like protein
MPLKSRQDPYGGYNFRVSVSGIADDGKLVQAAFTEVSGLEINVEPIEYRNGNDDKTPRKFSGLRKYANITLKRGVTGHIEFYKWLLKGANGKEDKLDGSIELLDEDQQTVMTWKFTKGWPCKFTGPGLNAANNEIAMETVEICHEGLTIDEE